MAKCCAAKGGGISQIYPIDNGHFAFAGARYRLQGGLIERSGVFQSKDEDTAGIGALVTDTANSPERLGQGNALRLEIHLCILASRAENGEALRLEISRDDIAGPQIDVLPWIAYDAL